MTGNEDIILVSHYTNSEYLTIVMGSQALAFLKLNVDLILTLMVSKV